ncbi:MAG: hypothetical protein OEZ33_01425 [Gammaproteobacteria bacterium]|nr:hypothetical protein [Gammaproteobacteria bacterium]MDH5776843.1 hypothetical protein [Gammaproteobacteria bacterium]
MPGQRTACFGKYDFNQIAEYARRRFVDGCNTIKLLEQAKSDKEREQIALVCMLDVEDKYVLDIQLDCKYAKDCKVTNCRQRLRQLIDKELAYPWPS